jgi:prefoldin subunit 5
MNSNTIVELLQQSVRIAIGATTSLVETIQDPQKRNSVLSDFQQELNQRSEQWSQKGEETEQEARKVIEKFFNRQSSSNIPTSNNSASGSSSSNNKNIDNELKELTEQIVALKKELEELRKP